MQEKNPNTNYNTTTGKISTVAAGGPAHKDYRVMSSLPMSANQKPEQANVTDLKFQG